MEEQREETEFVGDCREPMEEACKELGLSSKTETLDCEDANLVEVSDSGGCGGSGTDENPNPSVRVIVGSVIGEESVVVETMDNVEKTVSSDGVETTDAITEPETERNNMECRGDTGTVEVKPVDERECSELCDDVQRVSETVNLVEVEMKDEAAMIETKSKNGENHESAGEEESVISGANEVTDEKETCEVEVNSGACDAEQKIQTEKSLQSSVDGEMLSVAENKADQEKESTKKSKEDNNKMGLDSKQEKENILGVFYNAQGNSRCEMSDADQENESAKKSEEDNNEMDADSKHANEENIGLNEQGNLEYEATDAKHSESTQVPEDPTQLSRGKTIEENLGGVLEVISAAEICLEEEIINVNQEEENGEAMDIDYAAEGHVDKDVTVGGVLDNTGNESAGASMIQTQDVPTAEAERNASNVVKEMEVDERKDNADMANDLTGTTESADSANPNSPTEDAATGEVEPLDHNALFDPSFDITNFIDFGGVSSWSGNIQDHKIESGSVSLKEDKKAIDLAEEVATVDKKILRSVDATLNAEPHDNPSLSSEGIQNDSSEACAALGAESLGAATECPREASDAIAGSDEIQEDKDHEFLDKKTIDQQGGMREEDDSTHEAPSIDPNQKEDTEMEEYPNNYNNADDGTDSDIRTSGVKRKADVLSEDSPGEGRKTVSLAKVSFAQRPSFKIGACIARAASQMAGSPSVLKGSNFGGETLSVESFVSQLHCAATDPVKEHVVSEIAAGFFLDFRNSSASQQVTPEKVSSKRARPSNSNIGGTEAFEFEEMGDTYWTDRVIHNGGEEQTPPPDKGNYQVVPVEFKPAQVQRTRRPYRRRQSQIIIPNSALEKPANFDENAPAELIMNFSEADTIPPENSLSKMFRHFGPIRESQTEVDKENNRARVVYRKGTDAEVAYNSAGRFSIFGTKAVNYELSYTITETFKVQPYVVCLGEEDAALCLPS